MAAIELRAVSRVHADGTRALDRIDLSVSDGELLVLVGASGCGKTTILRAIAGLEPISGQVLIDVGYLGNKGTHMFTRTYTNAIDPLTGDILALVGGRDFRVSQFNRASRSRRQPGSAFKPLLYAAALEHGFSPISVLSDLGHVPPQGPDEWSPRNAEADAPDALTLRAALLESDNRAATMLQHNRMSALRPARPPDAHPWVQQRCLDDYDTALGIDLGDGGLVS